MAIRKINNGDNAGDVRKALNSNFKDLDSGKANKPRILAPDDYTFNPNGVLQKMDVSNQAGVTAVNLSAWSYGDPSQAMVGIVNSSFPTVVAPFQHMVNGMPRAIPTNISDINDISFTVFTPDPLEFILAQGVVTVVDQIRTVDGFDTYRINGTASAELAGSDINTFEFSIYIGSIPNSYNTSSVLHVPMQGIPVNGIHIRHISGNGSFGVVGLRIDANASTNTFVTGTQHKIDFKTPLGPNDKVSVHLDLTTTFSDFLPESGITSGSLSITHAVDRVGLLQGRAVEVHGIANVVIDVPGESGVQPMHGQTKTLLQPTGILIDSGLTQMGGSYDVYAAMVKTVTPSINVVEIEVMSRAG